MRKKQAPKRVILPDPKFHSLLLAKFTNMVMLSGKKAVAEGIMYDAIDIIINRQSIEDPVDFIEKALDNIRPVVEVRSRRVGGATYQVPVEVRAERRTTLAMRWAIDAARKRSEKSMSAKLAGELLDAFQNRGSAVKKREDTHKMAEANKAFAHFRWGS
jgi:small subunit ribosomal protein S7